MKQTLALIVALLIAAPAFGQEAVGIIIGPADTHGNLREIAGLADPNASRILRWNDATNVIEWGVDATGGSGGSEELDLFAANPRNNAEFSPGTWRAQLGLMLDNDVQRYDPDLQALSGGFIGIIKGLDDDGGFAVAVAGTDYVAPDADLTDLADGTLTGSKVSGAVTVSGGTINNSVIGGTTPAAATFTNATVNGTLKLYDSVAAAYVDVTVEDSAVSYENLGGVLPMITADEAYDATGWNGDLTVPTKNAVRDKIEALGGGFGSTDIDTSAEIRTIVTDETGSGALVFGTSPTIGTPAISGGTINNATVGASTPASGAFTSLICNDSFYVKDTGASVSGRLDYTNSGGWSILDSALSAADLTVKNTAYNATSWNGVSKVPTMDAVRDLAVTLQPLDSDLTDLADGSLTGSAVASATTSAVGVSELATSAETTTGSDTTRTITPDGLRGSDYGKRFGQFICVGSATALTTGDGKGEVFYRVPSELNGWDLVGVAAAVDTVSSSGTPTFQVRRRRLTSATATSDADMLSTAITIDASEFDSKDATTAAVINTSNDDLQTGDRIFADCDTAGTGTKGMSITLVFKKP